MLRAYSLPHAPWRSCQASFLVCCISIIFLSLEDVGKIALAGFHDASSAKSSYGLSLEVAADSPRSSDAWGSITPRVGTRTPGTLRMPYGDVANHHA